MAESITASRYPLPSGNLIYNLRQKRLHCVMYAVSSSAPFFFKRDVVSRVHGSLTKTTQVISFPASERQAIFRDQLQNPPYIFPNKWPNPLLHQDIPCPQGTRFITSGKRDCAA
ncbi:hypothetical protein CEXT_744361 [Caerostris extrusa]|uniref:Uncharacterized protein n=1 Tax=Caerostris extrusa TaxID=172846 RepID=A0AAV4TDY1_CAEEX|nr:hypothetical protein CEXT_744361 [Caerostris extrusa]